MKFKKRILLGLLLIILLGFNIFNALYINPHSFKCRQESLKNEKIDDLLIAFLTDLHYNFVLNDEDLQKISNILLDYQPDAIIFGGDLCDYLATNPLSAENKATIIAFLANLQAPNGKYAVLGNHDLENSTTKEEVISILNEGGFRVLENEICRLYNHHGNYLNLIGLDSQLNGNPDSSILTQLNDNNFNLLVTHCPDLLNNIDYHNIDLALCGHSHGMQIYLPLLNFFYRAPAAQHYYRGKYQLADTLLDISNGLGTTKKGIRLFADAEIVFYRF